MAGISLNPAVTTVAAGLFNVKSDGYYQGMFLDDPAIRNELATGILATTETLPIWGGVGIFENIGPAGGVLGNTIGRSTTLTATSATGLAGFTVFNQAANWVNTPQSQVPSGGTSSTAPYFRLGSGARIAVNCEPGLAAALIAGPIGQQVSWNFKDDMLQTFVASGPTEAVTSMTWSATNGGQVAVVMAAATIVTGVGEVINVSGATNTGTGSLALLNGAHVVNTWTDSQHFTFLLPGTSTLWGTIGGTIVLNVGIGALACKVLDINQGNSRVVIYDPIANAVNWNSSGSTAIIQI